MTSRTLTSLVADSASDSAGGAPLPGDPRPRAVTRRCGTLQGRHSAAFDGPKMATVGHWQGAGRSIAPGGTPPHNIAPRPKPPRRPQAPPPRGVEGPSAEGRVQSPGEGGFLSVRAGADDQPRMPLEQVAPQL